MGIENIGRAWMWSFDPCDGPAGTIWWRWEARASSGDVVAQAARAFETLSECRSDAAKYGYLPPEKRRI